MTLVRQALADAQRQLEAAGVPDTAIDAQVLLMHAASWNRTQLFSSLNQEWPPAADASLLSTLMRRLRREPLAYITGHREFFGLELIVDRRVLVPRQETETLVEQVLGIVQACYPSGNVAIADVGTGSGAIAVSVAHALPKARIYATDVSGEALAVAGENGRLHHVDDRVTLLRGDLLIPIPAEVPLVVANLPYISEDAVGSLQPEIRLYEPLDALVSGKDGLDHVSRLLHQIAGRLSRPQWVVLELGTGQPQKVIGEARVLFPGMRGRVFLDLAGLERGVVLEL